MDVSQPQLRVVTEALTAIKEDAMTKITLSDSRVYGWSSQDIIAVSVNQGGSYSFVGGVDILGDEIHVIN